MAKREKFGKFVLLEEIDASGLGAEYRAAKLGPTGLEKIVTVLRLSPSLSANADAVKLLMDQVKFAAQLHNPNIVKVLGIGGKVGSPCWVSYEFIEGKSLKAVFDRTQQDRFPFSVDHGLLIASKVASALEAAHARKTPAGERYFHGLVTPANVIVSYDGEVKVRGFGYWPARARELGAVPADDALYLAPEQSTGGAGGPKSDIFSVGAILFETLTGERLLQPGAAFDPARVASARLQSPANEEEALPKPIREILQKSLTADPAARYAEIGDMRKAVDALLFSGDFTPTTFNLAFFMHSLFRDDIDREAKALADERGEHYLEFLADESHPPAAAAGPPSPLAAAAASAVAATTAKAAAPEPPAPVPTAPPAAPPPPAPAAAPAAKSPAGLPLVPPPPRPAAPPGPAATAAAPVAPPPAAIASAPPVNDSTVPVAVRDATSGFTFHKDEAGGGGKMPLYAGIGVLVLALGAGAYFLLGRKGPAAPAAVATPAPTTLSPEALAAMAKVKELEEKLAAFEAEKAAAAAKAEEEAKKKVEAQAAARGQAVDPAAVQRAQDEARRRAEAEQARRQQEERLRLEQEQKAAEARLAEEQRLAEQRRQDEEAARLAAAATATTVPATQAPAPTTTIPAVRPGMLVQLADAGVIAPVPLTTPPLQYPPIALRQGVEGRVALSILVDEKGTVTDAKVTTGAGGRMGLNEAAMENARRRRYRPGTKDGVPVKVWIPITVNFVLPR